MTIDEYLAQSRYSDPGPYTALFDQLPSDLDELTAVVRNLLVHYRFGGVALAPERLAEIDHRWLERLLHTDQQRFAAPLDAPRPVAERVAGCCRDYTLLTVAALRHQGVPARSRVGFAGYFAPEDDPGFYGDHVVAEYWNGERWALLDAELTPGPRWAVNPHDVPFGEQAAFSSAAQVWSAFRAGRIDAERYRVAPGHPAGGGWLVRNYVFAELAHRRRDELLLWDVWGAMATGLDADLELTDEIAALLLAADRGDDGAERELADRYRADPRLHPGARVRCLSPTGSESWADLVARGDG
jgi:hypothetical protein